jgi:hypothetical protein
MEKLLKDALSKRPYLARLRRAGPTLEEIEEILKEWKAHTEKLHMKVTDGTVKRLGSQGAAGWAVDAVSGKEVLIIEEAAFKNPTQLLKEVRHELAYEATREGSNGVP